MGKRCLCFCSSSRRRVTKNFGSARPARLLQLVASSPPSPPPTITTLLGGGGNENNGGSLVGKGKKKSPGIRLWMKFDRFGNSELVECDKLEIIKRVRIPARDLRILGSVVSHSSNILARERAIVVNLDIVRAIITAEEVLVLDPLHQAIIPFVDQLRQQLPRKSRLNNDSLCNDSPIGEYTEAIEELQQELPFEFRVLEVALQVVCAYFDSNVFDLERDAYPVLEELKRNVSTNNLESVRSLKSNLTRLLARLQKVRDEIEHLLDDDIDKANMYLTRKQMQNQQYEGLVAATDSNSIINAAAEPPQIGSPPGASLVATVALDDYDIKDLEMLLEAYFIQLDGTCNKINLICEYIDDTEDYVNVKLDNMRNELLQMQLILTTSMLPMTLEIMIAGCFTMNIPCTLYNSSGLFGYFAAGLAGGGFLLFVLILGYARWKKLLG